MTSRAGGVRRDRRRVDAGCHGRLLAGCGDPHRRARADRPRLRVAVSRGGSGPRPGPRHLRARARRLRAVGQPVPRPVRAAPQPRPGPGDRRRLAARDRRGRGDRAVRARLPRGAGARARHHVRAYGVRDRAADLGPPRVRAGRAARGVAGVPRRARRVRGRRGAGYAVSWVVSSAVPALRAGAFLPNAGLSLLVAVVVTGIFAAVVLRLDGGDVRTALSHLHTRPSA